MRDQSTLRTHVHTLPTERNELAGVPRVEENDASIPQSSSHGDSVFLRRVMSCQVAHGHSLCPNFVPKESCECSEVLPLCVREKSSMSKTIIMRDVLAMLDVIDVTNVEEKKCSPNRVSCYVAVQYNRNMT